MDLNDQLTINANEAMKLKDGDLIYRTLLAPFDGNAIITKVVAPSGESLNIKTTGYFKSIVKFELVK